MDWVVGLKTSQFHHLSIREHAYLNLDVLKMIQHICQSLNTSRKKAIKYMYYVFANFYGYHSKSTHAEIS